MVYGKKIKWLYYSIIGSTFACHVHIIHINNYMYIMIYIVVRYELVDIIRLHTNLYHNQLR